MLKNSAMNTNQVVKQMPGNIASDMDGEKVILSINNGKYFNLGNIGGIIWDRISESISVNALIDNLIEEFNVDKAVCESDVHHFLEKLHEEGLLYIE